MSRSKIKARLLSVRWIGNAYETHIEVIEDKRKDDKKYIAMLEDKLIAMASTGASSAPSHEHKNSVENILTDMISASEREITTLQGITTGIQKTLPQDNNNNNNNNASFHAWIDAVQEAGPPSESSFQSLEEGFADDEQEEREEPEHRSISELNADSEPESDSVEFILSPRPLFTPAPPLYRSIRRHRNKHTPSARHTPPFQRQRRRPSR